VYPVSSHMPVTTSHITTRPSSLPDMIYLALDEMVWRIFYFWARIPTYLFMMLLWSILTSLNALSHDCTTMQWPKNTLHSSALLLSSTSLSR